MKCKESIPSGARRGAGRFAALTPAALCRAPFLTVLLLLFLAGLPLRAQRAPETSPEPEDLEHRARLSVGQNIADYLFLGTLNADLQYSVHRYWTFGLGARYNNWTWRYGRDTQFESRQQSYYFSARWWPWYTYSGWWAGAKLQYQEYNRGGILSPVTEEGDAFGLAFGGGYAVHVNHWLNVDFGLYGWGGMTRYVTYACPYCGQRTDTGTKAFLLPDEARIALQFIF